MFAKNRYLVIAAILCALGAGIAQAQTWKPVQGGISGGSTARTCYYMYSSPTSCGTGFEKMPGSASQGSGSSHDICCTTSEGGGLTDTAGILQGGYFVLTGQTYTGNLGGLAGANASCLSEVQSHPWKGKGSAGILTAARVKAFLCSGTTCQNLLPYTKYTFARSRYPTIGGASFTTDIDGRGPNDTNNWGNGSWFGTNDVWWSGRNQGSSPLWENTPTTNHCANWSGIGSSGTVGSPNDTGSGRWNSYFQGCGASQLLVCYVNPE